jgi:hypothetical protein
MGRTLGADDANPHGIERPSLAQVKAEIEAELAQSDARPMPPESSLTLTPRAIEVLDAWRTDAIATSVGVAEFPNAEPIISMMNCLVALLRMGGTGYAESDTLIVVNTTSGLTVGMHRDRKGVCSLNS